MLMGRRSYDNSIAAWGGKGPLGEVPCLVVTHRPPASAGPVFTFVPDGIESALAKTQEVAGDKRIALMGAELDQQYLAQGQRSAPVLKPGGRLARQGSRCYLATHGKWGSAPE